MCYIRHLFGQLGTDIDGESVNDNSGRSVAFNAAGNRIIMVLTEITVVLLTPVMLECMIGMEVLGHK